MFLNGAPEPPGLLRSIVEGAKLVVAADGGALRALEAGVVPDLVVGDMDSLGEARAREIEGLGATLERHATRKDEMDGHLAVVAAKKRGATDVDLVCATGGRLSAVFALPHILLAAERAGLGATVVAGWGRAFVVEGGGRPTVEGRPGDSISVFPLTDPATGVTLEGVAYPLRDARMEVWETLGFHNELLVGGKARVSVGGGAVLVIHETERSVP